MAALMQALTILIVLKQVVVSIGDGLAGDVLCTVDVRKPDKITMDPVYTFYVYPQ
jgi:hypothetical protein